MTEISRFVCFGILAGMSVMDIKVRKIPVLLLVTAIVAAIIYQVLFRTENLMIVIGGMVISVFFFFVSMITEESIGYGDCFGILGLGIYLGLWKLLEVLAGTFFLLICGAMVELFRKKMSRKCALPFFPFLAAGYLLWMILD